MRVEADLFSGRPNPDFTLSPDQASDLLRLLRELPPGATQVEPPGLGYRGFLIHDPGSAFPGCNAWRAFHGTVTGECGSESRIFADPSRRLERWLLKVSFGRLDPGIYAAIAGDLQEP